MEPQWKAPKASTEAATSGALALRASILLPPAVVQLAPSPAMEILKVEVQLSAARGPA
jgi:hypothetical protein